MAGRGFIALSAVIFGRWMPTGVMFACLLFGFCDALQIRSAVKPSTPYQILQMIPYLCTLFVLAFFGIKKSGPRQMDSRITGKNDKKNDEKVKIILYIGGIDYEKRNMKMTSVVLAALLLQ